MKNLNEPIQFEKILLLHDSVVTSPLDMLFVRLRLKKLAIFDDNLKFVLLQERNRHHLDRDGLSSPHKLACLPHMLVYTDGK